MEGGGSGVSKGARSGRVWGKFWKRKGEKRERGKQG